MCGLSVMICNASNLLIEFTGHWFGVKAYSQATALQNITLLSFGVWLERYPADNHAVQMTASVLNRSLHKGDLSVVKSD